MDESRQERKGLTTANSTVSCSSNKMLSMAGRQAFQNPEAQRITLTDWLTDTV
jgi:hypothetical protein